MTKLEDNLIRLLEPYPGIDCAKPASRLADHLGIVTRELRSLKRHLVLVHHLPMGSTTRGFFWAKNDHELMKMANYYDGLIRKASPMKAEYLDQVKAKEQGELF